MNIFDACILGLVLFVLIAGSFILMRRALIGMVSTYQFQSLLISIIAFLLFLEGGNYSLLGMAFLVLAVKVFLIPWFIGRIQGKMNVRRDLGAAGDLSPAFAIILSFVAVVFVFAVFSRVLSPLSLGGMPLLGSIAGVSLLFVGLLILAVRKHAVSKVIGYLTMENGVVLAGLFLSEFSFMLEFLVCLDLIMLVALSVVLAFGVDSGAENGGAEGSAFSLLFDGGEAK